MVAQKQETQQKIEEEREEIEEDYEDEFQIEDNYPVDSENVGSEIDDMDFDYSQSQLEQFLSSQNLRGSNI